MKVLQTFRKQSPDYKESAYERKVRLRKAKHLCSVSQLSNSSVHETDGHVERSAEERRERGQKDRRGRAGGFYSSIGGRQRYDDHRH